MKRIIHRSVLLLAAMMLPGCYETYSAYSPGGSAYRIAEIEYDLAASTAGSLSEGRVFYHPNTLLSQAEKDYRDCLVQARMATAPIRDLLARRLQEHTLTRDAMIARGYRQIPWNQFPAGLTTTLIDGVAVGGSYEEQP